MTQLDSPLRTHNTYRLRRPSAYLHDSTHTPEVLTSCCCYPRPLAASHTLYIVYSFAQNLFDASGLCFAATTCRNHGGSSCDAKSTISLETTSTSQGARKGPAGHQNGSTAAPKTARRVAHREGPCICSAHPAADGSAPVHTEGSNGDGGAPLTRAGCGGCRGTAFDTGGPDTGGRPRRCTAAPLR